MRIYVVIAGLVSFWTMVAGLVVGEGELRVGGLLGLFLSIAAAVAIEVACWLRERRHHSQVEGEADPFAELDYLRFEWPQWADIDRIEAEILTLEREERAT